MFMGDSILIPTGYANIIRNITKRLSKNDDYEVQQFAWAYTGRPMYANFDKMFLADSPQKHSTLMIPTSMRTQWGEDLLLPMVNKYKPDLFFAVADSFMLQYMLNSDLSPSKTLFYFPSDGHPFPLGCEKVVKKFHYPVAMSKYAQQQAIDDYGITNCDYIPCGVETSTFFPYPDDVKAGLRRKWTSRLNIDLQDKFIVGAIARNQGRKDVPGMIKAFANFAQNKHDAVLLLHMDPNDPASYGIGLFDLINRLKIGAKVAFTGMKWFEGFPENEMNELYNLFDTQLSLNTGEGFGITTIEGFAAKVPIIMTDFTTFKEIVSDNNAGLPIKIAGEICGSFNVMRAFGDKEHAAEQLQYYYDNRSVMKQHGENGYKAVQRDYSWDTVVYPKWFKKIEGILQ
jgi:glycosyltransferase involved in cell wall biosynthesis